ncbi:hypothetical protein [Methanogenium organophilum]|uniref:Uncharacterized protein n=1 Tax=Methanogenium organophilum TaxID=2199 RepID=A0A9X9S4I5_METOG|nr:hypothetical protein [Methanogenium organophilum]WAI01592.1 hypothetical protein OU421_01590 [Methanogenium organophilum]
MQEIGYDIHTGACRRYRSYTMNALDAIFIPGTHANRIASITLMLAARRYRHRLMVISLLYTILMYYLHKEGR